VAESGLPRSPEVHSSSPRVSWCAHAAGRSGSLVEISGIHAFESTSLWLSIGANMFSLAVSRAGDEIPHDGFSGASPLTKQPQIEWTVRPTSPAADLASFRLLDRWEYERGSAGQASRYEPDETDPKLQTPHDGRQASIWKERAAITEERG